MSLLRLAPFAVLVPVAVLALNVPSVRSAVVGVFQVGQLRGELNSELELGERLELVNVEIQRRIAIKEQLVGDLIAGRTTLACVTEQFLALNQGRPEYMRVIRVTYPGVTDFEKSAHNVIGYTEGELGRYPAAQQDEVRRRLQAELRDLFRTSAGAAN
ncbi:hypothetical protein [Gemmata sp.]|uniref:hypothetical protein n=1 Tax=Gemmata sp. TaxID=1914242 RepID=UPI003F71DEA6